MLVDGWRPGNISQVPPQVAFSQSGSSEPQKGKLEHLKFQKRMLIMGEAVLVREHTAISFPTLLLKI